MRWEYWAMIVATSVLFGLLYRMASHQAQERKSGVEDEMRLRARAELGCRMLITSNRLGSKHPNAQSIMRRVLSEGHCAGFDDFYSLFARERLTKALFLV